MEGFRDRASVRSYRQIGFLLSVAVGWLKLPSLGVSHPAHECVTQPERGSLLFCPLADGW